jgi:hypothetical protein
MKRPILVRLAYSSPVAATVAMQGMIVWYGLQRIASEWHNVYARSCVSAAHCVASRCESTPHLKIRKHIPHSCAAVTHTRALQALLHARRGNTGGEHTSALRAQQECRDVQSPFSRCEAVGVGGVQREIESAILQCEAAPARHEPCAEPLVAGHHRADSIASIVDDLEADRAGGRCRAAVLQLVTHSARGATISGRRQRCAQTQELTDRKCLQPRTH